MAKTADAACGPNSPSPEGCKPKRPRIVGRLDHRTTMAGVVPPSCGQLGFATRARNLFRGSLASAAAGAIVRGRVVPAGDNGVLALRGELREQEGARLCASRAAPCVPRRRAGSRSRRLPDPRRAQGDDFGQSRHRRWRAVESAIQVDGLRPTTHPGEARAPPTPGSSVTRIRPSVSWRHRSRARDRAGSGACARGDLKKCSRL